MPTSQLPPSQAQRRSATSWCIAFPAQLGQKADCWPICVAAESTTRAKLKHPTGWFAAGREVISAMALLSDGAFKLYMLLCLRADRSTGRLEVDQASLAKSLAKSRRSIVVYFEEL